METRNLLFLKQSCLQHFLQLLIPAYLLSSNSLISGKSKRIIYKYAIVRTIDYIKCNQWFMNKDLILTLYSVPHTVFSIKEVSLLLPDIKPNNLRRRLHYFVKVGKLKNPRWGIYVKNEYNALELANKIYTPSYISFETVLFKKGIVFQVYETIFVASYLSRHIIVDNTKIFYRQINMHALLNTSGIEEIAGYFIASAERAFLDAVFLYKNYHFDNLGGLDWEKVFDLVPMYENHAFEKRVKEYYEIYKEEL